jgi:hypothetical protein
MSDAFVIGGKVKSCMATHSSGLQRDQDLAWSTAP